MEGRDLAQADLSSPVKSSSEVENPSKVIDSLFNEWTDEKHSLYLSSIEASFVNQLYGREHLSSNLMVWLSRSQKKTNSSQTNPNKQQAGQFKVQLRGHWEDVRFQQEKSKAMIENNPHDILENPWIQHFQSPSICKQELASRSNNFCPMEKKKSRAKHHPDFYPLMFHQDSVGSRAEVTDQNFVDKEYKQAEEPSKASSKKRSRGAAYSQINDQIVPSQPFAASSAKTGACLKENDSEVNNTSSQQNKDGGSSYFKNKEPEGLGFSNGLLCYSTERRSTRRTK